MKKLVKTSVVILLSIALNNFSNVFAQQPDKAKMLAEKINSKNFIFVANSLTPLSGPLRILTDPYDVKVNADSIVSYLPFYGRSTQPPTTNEEAGIMFTSVQFDYASATGKKKTWDIDIKFKDQKNTSSFSFIIYENGEASLNVTSMYRDPVSFRGYIKM